MAKYEVWITLLILGVGFSESVSHTSGVNEATDNHFAKSMQKTLSKRVATPRVLKFDTYETSESIPSGILHPPPRVAANHHFSWFSEGTKPESSESNWFGFNHFIPRSARNLPIGTNYRLRNANLLGESTGIYPVTHFESSPSFYIDHSAGFHHHINDQQSQSTIPYHNHFPNSRFNTLEQPMKFPQGFLVPARHRHQVRNTNNQRHRNSNYHHSNHNLQRSSTSPTRMAIKIVPLNLSSIDITNALKSMSWFPIPIDFLKGSSSQNNAPKDNSQQVYSDKRQSMFDDEDESDLPPPSSHVATPPLGITYAEGQRSERFVNRFQPRK